MLPDRFHIAENPFCLLPTVPVGRLIGFLATFCLLLGPPQLVIAQATLYFEDFDDDAGATSVGNGWTASWDALGSSGAVADVQNGPGINYAWVFGSGGTANTNYFAIWESDPVSCTGYLTLDATIETAGNGIDYTLRLLDAATLVELAVAPQNTGAISLPSHNGEIIIRVDFATTSKDKSMDLLTVGLTGVLDLSDCTDTTACNFSVTPGIGPCQYLDVCGVCGGNGTTWSMTTNPLSGGGQQTFTFVATAVDTLETIDITLNAVGGTSSNNWASDLLIAIIDPNGNAVQWGGYNITSYGQGYTDIADWPFSWNEGAEEFSPWTITVDVSAGGLSGTGIWTVRLANGSTIGSAAMVYNLDMGIQSLCEVGVGCTESMACNYDAAAEFDDGSCIILPFGDCGCSTSVNTVASLAGGASSAVTTVDGGRNIGLSAGDFGIHW